MIHHFRVRDKKSLLTWIYIFNGKFIITKKHNDYFNLIKFINYLLQRNILLIKLFNTNSKFNKKNQ